MANSLVHLYEVMGLNRRTSRSGSDQPVGSARGGQDYANQPWRCQAPFRGWLQQKSWWPTLGWKNITF